MFFSNTLDECNGLVGVPFTWRTNSDPKPLAIIRHSSLITLTGATQEIIYRSVEGRFQLEKPLASVWPRGWQGLFCRNEYPAARFRGMKRGTWVAGKHWRRVASRVNLPERAIVKSGLVRFASSTLDKGEPVKLS